ncbi:MAG: PAS domain-containing protein [Anaeromyxobacter sp.]|nr:PAS domain-containing protein [Anaeromyxobacter sp.]MBL0277177.1 PAS domain-containing protein [Anaeromyxobacter sp.]
MPGRKARPRTPRKAAARSPGKAARRPAPAVSVRPAIRPAVRPAVRPAAVAPAVASVAPQSGQAPGPIIVGLGASAGGLNALEQFFANTPPGLGLAYVVVQHLDPEHVSALVPLLQRISRLPVVEATDGMTAQADVVHVIPPNRELAIAGGVLALTLPSAPRGQRMAVDGFLGSLARDQGGEAVGVILSGTGSDGAHGLLAIHQAGGLCLVQAPPSARFDGMPLAALAAVPASLVAPADRLPAALAGALELRGPGGPTRPSGLPRAAPSSPPPAAAGALDRVLATLRTATGRDFSRYKRSSVARRVERRMAANAIGDLEVYARHLREHPAEVKTLFQDLLINVTGFFRDPQAFQALQDQALEKLVMGKAAGEVVRVWVAGCASGEEAYSIAILLREVLDRTQRELKVQVYATDLDGDAIAAARAGVYPGSIQADVSPERLRRFFVAEGAGYRVKKEIREQVVFAVHDLLKDPPFTRLDLLSCRNVFIYLESALQSRLLDLFHYALRPGGVLFLSPAEGLGDRADLFTPLDRKWRLFRARRGMASAGAVLTSGLAWVRHPGSETMRKTQPGDFAEMTRRLLLASYAPASVLTDREGTILFVHGDTGPYLRPAPGQPTLSVAEMAREGLQLEVRAALRRAGNTGKAVRRPGIPVRWHGATQTVDLTVRPVATPAGAPPLLLVTFQEARAAAPTKAAGAKGGRRAAGQDRSQELARALAATRESLQATIEEQQTSQEELQASNEELQSTNEEVQASNEELETAKEELQSVNEELTTVNAELQAKVEQLTGMQDDLKNLFEAISVATVFLDERLRVKRFSREACRLYRLAAGDVGRPLVDLKSNLVDHDLLAEAQLVLDTLVPVEREVRTTAGAWYLARLVPYRTVDGVIRGVVLTFTDISGRVAAEAAARVERELAERVMASVREPLLVLDAGLRVVTASPSFHRAFGTTPPAVAGRHVYELAERRWDLPALRELLERVLPHQESFEGFEVKAAFADGAPHTMRLDARRISGGAGAIELILLGFSLEPRAAGAAAAIKPAAGFSPGA